MRISLNWLRELVDLEGLSVEEIQYRLTMTTALIESVETTAFGLADVLIGLVSRCEPHPEAAQLHLCEVDCGDGGHFAIVCGAPNVRAGQKVPVALPGATLPGGLKVGKRKLRGVMSEGMICSERELALGDAQDGIMVVDSSAAVGSRLVDYLGLVDHVLEIDNKSITHRPDLWGHVGFARELGAIFGRSVALPPLDESLQAGRGSVPVSVEDYALCPRYLALAARGVAHARAPAWMVRRLEACGVRSINLAVDLSNYVMLEIGQPTHPFDVRRLRGGRIVVRRARAGERIQTIDHVDRELAPDMLVIADTERPIAIAGVMGGAESEVCDDTDAVVLESAAFDAVSLRATCSTLGLRTDAVARFEKFLDHRLPETATRRYVWLLSRCCPNAEVEMRYTEACRWQHEPLGIGLRPERARMKLGLELDTGTMIRHLGALGFGVSREGEVLRVQVPSWRGTRDVTIEDDLIEEIGRLHGYDAIEATLPAVSCAPPVRDPLRDLENAVSDILVQRCAMTEVLDYSMVDERSLRIAGASLAEPYLQLRNPIAAEAARLRRSLVPGMLRFVEVNDKVAEEFAVFQIGRSYLAERGVGDGLPLETRELVAIEALRRGGAERSALRQLKGRMETLFECLGRAVSYASTAESELVAPWLHPGRCAVIGAQGERVGRVGDLHPEVLARMDIERDVAIAMIDLAALLEIGESAKRFEPIPRFPPVRIDLAVVAGWEITIDQIVAEMRAVAAGLLREVKLFDIFSGGPVPEGKRSLAFRLSFRSDERTLTDAETLALRDAILRRLGSMGLELR
ncbi:MAG: phenylalanine--tRNA ligase subunit beta [Planctomycetota bacterium]